MYSTGITGNGRSPYRAVSYAVPGGITFGPWLTTVWVPPVEASRAVVERSRHTMVGSCATVSAVLCRTRVTRPGVVPVAAGTTGRVQVTSPPLIAWVPGPLASVIAVPVGEVTVTTAPVTGAVVGLVTMIRDG